MLVNFQLKLTIFRNFAEIWEFQILSLITENRDWNSKIGSPFLLRLYTLSTYPKFQEKWSTTGPKTRSSKTPKIASLETHKSKQKTKFKNLLPICCQYFLEERTVKVWCKSVHHRPRNSITDNPLKWTRYKFKWKLKRKMESSDALHTVRKGLF